MKSNNLNIDSEILSDDDNDYDKKKYDKDDKYDKDEKDEKDEDDEEEEYKEKENDEEIEIEIENDEDCIYEELYDINKIKKSKRINDEDRITMNKLTKYERTKIICARSQQIENGSKIMLNYEGDINKLLSIQIAELELQNKVIPILVKRYLPNGDYEIWKVSELF